MLPALQVGLKREWREERKLGRREKEGREGRRETATCSGSRSCSAWWKLRDIQGSWGFVPTSLWGFCELVLHGERGRRQLPPTCHPGNGSPGLKLLDSSLHSTVAAVFIQPKRERGTWGRWVACEHSPFICQRLLGRRGGKINPRWPLLPGFKWNYLQGRNNKCYLLTFTLSRKHGDDFKIIIILGYRAQCFLSKFLFLYLF